MPAIYKKGLLGFGAGVMFAVNALTPVQGFPPVSISPGFSDMNGFGAAANKSLLLSCHCFLGWIHDWVVMKGTEE